MAIDTQPAFGDGFQRHRTDVGDGHCSVEICPTGPLNRL
jgi:hypothetical protein